MRLYCVSNWLSVNCYKRATGIQFGWHKYATAVIWFPFIIPQVRRAGAVACVRLYTHAPQSVLDCGLINALYEGLRDSDPIVITNCILALDCILQDEGGVVVNKNIAHYLLGRIMQFSECNAVYVLTLLLRLVWV